jgi:23S rRNA (uracil1939-C5)-methyltransferase
VNTAQAERVVPLLLDFFGPPRGSYRLVEAYCGIGTFSLPLARAGHALLGLELHVASVQQARDNARRNGLADLVEFREGDVADHLAQALATGNAQGLLVDPPRKGLPPEVLNLILATPPERVAYISCNPDTLARDLEQLCQTPEYPERPYRLQLVQPIDFFPQTSHVETVVLLLRV